MSLDKKTKNKVIKLLQNGAKYEEIQRKTHVSSATISNIKKELFDHTPSMTEEEIEKEKEILKNPHPIISEIQPTILDLKHIENISEEDAKINTEEDAKINTKEAPIKPLPRTEQETQDIEDDMKEELELEKEEEEMKRAAEENAKIQKEALEKRQKEQIQIREERRQEEIAKKAYIESEKKKKEVLAKTSMRRAAPKEKPEEFKPEIIDETKEEIEEEKEKNKPKKSIVWRMF